jgi:Transposase DDE domain group 1
MAASACPIWALAQIPAEYVEGPEILIRADPAGATHGMIDYCREGDLSAWPERCRLIVRRERPHPGAQLSFTDHDGYRFQAILTDQTDAEIALLECSHRQHAHVEDRIRDDKDTGLAKFPFKEFQLNEVWLEIVMLAHDLIVWTQALALTGELAKAEPKRLRYRLLHVAGRLAF